MNEITLEKLHALVEKLAEFVINEVPTRQEVANKDDIQRLREELLSKEDFQIAVGKIMAMLDEKADKSEVEKIRKDVDQLIQGMDAVAGELQSFRIERMAQTASFRRLEKRVEVLEEKVGV